MLSPDPFLYKQIVYNPPVLESFASAETERLFATGKSRRIPTEILRRAIMRLAQLDAATLLDDQRGNAQDVEIVDYHGGPNTMKTQKPVNGLPALHPGEFLRETLAELGLTQAALAEAIGVSPMRVSHLLRGDRPVTAELALRLGRALGQAPQYWLNLQTTYDLKMAQAEMKNDLRAVRKLGSA